LSRAHGSRRSSDPEGAIDFSSNVNCFGPPASVLEALSRDLAGDVSSYPDPDYPALRQALAFYAGRRPDEILPSNGSVDALFWLSYCLRPARALVIAPAFCEYGIAVRAAGAEVEECLMDSASGFALDMDLATEKASRAGIVFVSNPNSPTGRSFSRVEMLELSEALPPGGLLLVDEAFMDFCSGADELSCISDVSEKIWVLRSLTKFFGLAGLRAGYLIAPAADIMRVKGMTPPWSMNRVAERAAVAALDDTEFIAEMPSLIAAERERFAGLLEGTGLVMAFPSCANFLLLEIADGLPGGTEIAARLLPLGFLVRDAAGFSGLTDRFIRVAVRTATENEALVEALHAACERDGGPA